jgi:hypothetical protein
VVKTIETLKENDFESEFEPLVRTLLARVPSIKLIALEREKILDSNLSYRADYLVTLEVGRESWSIVLEAKRLGQPQAVREAISQLQEYLRLVPSKLKYGVVLAPFISTESARLCDEAGVGYADLSGNAKLAFGGIYISTWGKENAFKERKEAKSLFSPKSQRALLTLLQGPLRSWGFSELAKEAQVSVGWISALKQQLVAREWARNERGGIFLTQPNAILDAWVVADDWKKRTEVRQYSLLETEPVEIAKALVTSLQNRGIAFTQWFAGWARQPYTLPPIVTAYVKEWPKEGEIEKTIQARQVSQGGRLWLVKPKDEGVFRPGQETKGFPLVSDVQIFLDLQRAGQRGDEQAAELRKRKDFSGGWG